MICGDMLCGMAFLFPAQTQAQWTNGEGWIGGEYNLRVEAGCFFFFTAGCLTTRIYTARSNGVCVYVCVCFGGGQGPLVWVFLLHWFAQVLTLICTACIYKWCVSMYCMCMYVLQKSGLVLD